MHREGQGVVLATMKWISHNVIKRRVNECRPWEPGRLPCPDGRSLARTWSCGLPESLARSSSEGSHPQPLSRRPAIPSLGSLSSSQEDTSHQEALTCGGRPPGAAGRRGGRAPRAAGLLPGALCPRAVAARRPPVSSLPPHR